MLHGKVDIARACQLAWPASLLTLICRPTETLQYQILGVVVAPSSRSELGNNATAFQQRASFLVRFVDLAFVAPICFNEFEVCFTDKGEKWDLVEYGVKPQAFGVYAEVAQVAVGAGIVGRIEL